MLAPKIKINIHPEVVSDVNTFGTNGTNIHTAINAAGQLAPDTSNQSHKFDTGLALGNTAIGAIQTANMTTKSVDSKHGFLGQNGTNRVAFLGGVLGVVGVLKDGYDIYGNYAKNNNLRDIKIGEILTLSANALAVESSRSAIIAGGGLVVAGTTVGAPVGAAAAISAGIRFAVTGALSIILNATANSIDSNTTIGDVLDKTGNSLDKAWKYFNDNIASGDFITKALEKAGEKVVDFSKYTHEEMEALKKSVLEYIKDVLDGIKEAVKEIEKAIKEQTDNFIEKIDDLSDHIAGELARWLGLNRDGKHYFVDPLVLDLDGDGIETVGHNKKLGAMFDLECVNDGVYGLVA